jgi:hypothetical protein
MSCSGQVLFGVQQLARQRMEQQSRTDFVMDANLLTGTSHIREQLVELLQKFKTSSFPTAAPNANNTQQCIEDSLFYVESLTLNRSNWALQSKPFIQITKFDFQFTKIYLSIFYFTKINSARVIRSVSRRSYWRW